MNKLNSMSYPFLTRDNSLAYRLPTMVKRSQQGVTYLVGNPACHSDAYESILGYATIPMCMD